VKNGLRVHSEMLEVGERIIGYKSRADRKTEAVHRDFQFVIGRLV